jgi:hypothetical protein
LTTEVVKAWVDNWSHSLNQELDMRIQRTCAYLQATKMLKREFEKLIHVNWFEVKDGLGEVCM